MLWAMKPNRNFIHFIWSFSLYMYKTFHFQYLRIQNLVVIINFGFIFNSFPPSFFRNDENEQSNVIIILRLIYSKKITRFFLHEIILALAFSLSSFLSFSRSPKWICLCMRMYVCFASCVATNVIQSTRIRSTCMHICTCLCVCACVCVSGCLSVCEYACRLY